MKQCKTHTSNICPYISRFCVNKFIYRSGTEEENEGRDQLLTELATLQDEKVRLKGEEAKRNEEKDNQ